jgi:hypothetical protein
VEECAVSEEKSDSDLTPTLERTDYPPLLNVVLPALILVISVAYAWSLHDIFNAEMNLLLLKPLFVVIWVLLAVVIAKDVLPSIRLHREWMKHRVRRHISLGERFAPGTEMGAGLVVAATFAFALFGPGNGTRAYLVSAFLYLAVAGYLIGDRQPIWLIGQAALLSTGLYVVMGIILGVPL